MCILVTIIQMKHFPTEIRDGKDLTRRFCQSRLQVKEVKFSMYVCIHVLGCNSNIIVNYPAGQLGR